MMRHVTVPSDMTRQDSVKEDFVRKKLGDELKNNTHVITMGQVATVWQTKTHEAVLGLQERC